MDDKIDIWVKTIFKFIFFFFFFFKYLLKSVYKLLFPGVDLVKELGEFT